MPAQNDNFRRMLMTTRAYVEGARALYLWTALHIDRSDRHPDADVRKASSNSVALMTTDHLGDIRMGFGRQGVGFGLGFAVTEDQAAVGELGSTGEFNWGGAAGTRFWVDPQENLIGIFMVQSMPHRTRLGSEFKILTYQALVE